MKTQDLKARSTLQDEMLALARAIEVKGVGTFKSATVVTPESKIFVIMAYLYL